MSSDQPSTRFPNHLPQKSTASMEKDRLQAGLGSVSTSSKVAPGLVPKRRIALQEGVHDHEDDVVMLVTKKQKTEKQLTTRAQFFDPREPTKEFTPIYHFRRSDAEMMDDSVSKCNKITSEITRLCPADSSNPDSIVFQSMFERMTPRTLNNMGDGYDIEDSFVDNSVEEVDAVIPSGWTTQMGGFYIGTGKLYIRPLEPGEAETGLYRKANAKECQKAMRKLNKRAPKRKIPAKSLDTQQEATATMDSNYSLHSTEV